MRFCGTITSYCIGKRDLVNNTIPCKMLPISCACALRLLVLRLQAELNFLCRSSMDTIYMEALANLCLSTLENINLSIPRRHFDITKSVNVALQAFLSNMLVFSLCWH